ncbi:Tim44/TimA family putative adaptor protein [Skermanella mucosa]|uniref:Tim44/TimA family putative adaptor protein n=1 Tax=Skermanella mucosa TaxID=1789672 RepID=UPI00192C1866|nr:Tim44/TimA family putative adaptor protein [Skermanella mucosa]UEM21022.1 Tim44/TimA family putative adaptor protein [Skermanella mucosa]
MGEGFYFIDILIFAMIAAFLVYRLRGVLGRRHGEERQRPNPYTPRPGQEGGDNVVTLPDRGRLPVDLPPPAPDEPYSLAAGIAQIQANDPTFDEKNFVQGARAAFEMIVTAFAQGDTPTLRPLLSDDVYDNFAAAIRNRQAAGETLETQVIGIRDSDVIEARMEGRTAFVTIKFVSDQVNITRDKAGEVIDGDPEQPLEVVDIWTFARNTRSRNPNWTLIETRVPN